ncbi:putative PIN and TRAM-domain containing protein YacL [bacterium HR15]|nr:putative PIN and TRAM-domain containing protein YacL [bacterium HR15]
MTIHRLMYWLFVAVGMVLFATVGFLLTDPFLRAVSQRWGEDVMLSPLWTRIGFTTAGLLLGILVGNHGFELLSRVAQHLEEAEPDEKLAIGLGLLSAAVITFALYPLLFAIGGSRLGWTLTLLAFVVLVYLSVVSFLSMKEYLPITAQMARRSRGIKVLDTSVIIDGRIRDIWRSGFLEGRLYVPGFVLDELQHIADSEDPLRRARGRRGLDVLKQLQQEAELEVRTHDRLAPPASDGVDGRLVRLAKALRADIITNDYNLNRVAELQGVRVLNINELAEAVRIHVLPGEELTVTPIREGQEPDQGVAYLEDGTMVVVEGGRAYLNQAIDVVVTSVLQSARGKMLFAEPKAWAESTESGVEYGTRAYRGSRKGRPIR